MRVLFLTNFCPPHHLGGQGQSCKMVVEALSQRGHTVSVLTSMHGVDNLPQKHDKVYRWLYLEMDLAPWRHMFVFFTKRKIREERTLRRFDHLADTFKPDIVFIWGMWNLPRSLPARAEKRFPGRVVFRFAEYWPTLPSQHELYWRTSSRRWFSWLPKAVLGRIALTMLANGNHHRPKLRFEHAYCVSAATRDELVTAGIPVQSARVIHTGIDPDIYLIGDGNQPAREVGENLKLLYAGRLSAEKGLDTIIQAVHKLVFEEELRKVRLSIAGSGDVDYENHLRELVDQMNVADYVQFLGHLPPEEMPQLFRKHHALIVSSVWIEPFARVVLEGMASGLVVVASSIGGAPEIIINGVNGLLFAPGDHEDLSAKIIELASNPKLQEEISRAAQKTILDDFTEESMMDEIENYLREIAEKALKNEGAPQPVEEEAQ